jgi:heme exporter protein D
MNLGPHAAFIWASYAATALVVALLIAFLVLEGRRYRRHLDSLEARGITRRGNRPGQARARDGD